MPAGVARLVVGFLFLISGWGKVGHIDKFVGDFAGWGFPAPQLLAPLAAWAEFLSGGLLIVGLLTRLASVAMMINMVVAIAAVRLKSVHTVGDFLYLPEVLLVALLFWLAVEGPGKVSVDHWAER
jgi:putative oxidoreductase